MTAMKTARQAAKTAFDNYLEFYWSTATRYVPECVIDAAHAAYAAAGGDREIVVVGSGNSTHRVCSVDVRLKKKCD